MIGRKQLRRAQSLIQHGVVGVHKRRHIATLRYAHGTRTGSRSPPICLGVHSLRGEPVERAFLLPPLAIRAGLKAILFSIFLSRKSKPVQGKSSDVTNRCITTSLAFAAGVTTMKLATAGILHGERQST